MKKILSGIVILLILSCSSSKTEEQPAAKETPDIITLTDAQYAQAGIKTGEVRQQVLNTELRVNGIVDVPPQNIVSISFPLGGYLRTTDLLPGMHVNKGQVIARVEDQALVQLQQDYLVALARLQYLEKEYARQKMLNENKVNADKIFQQAEADYSSQKILVRSLGEKLRLVNIVPERLDENTISRSVPVYSPINGFVSKVNVNIGKYVKPEDVLFELINPDDMHAALTVFEKDLPNVFPGQKVWVSFVEDPSKEYECEVLLVTKNVDDNRSALVHCHFETQPRQLLPGMFLNARIMVDSAKVLAVPEEAVVRYGESEYLFEATGGNSFKLIKVEKGIKENGMVAVKSQETSLDGKTIVTANAYALLSQMMNTGEEE